MTIAEGRLFCQSNEACRSKTCFAFVSVHHPQKKTAAIIDRAHFSSSIICHRHFSFRKFCVTQEMRHFCGFARRRAMPFLVLRTP